MVMELPDLGDHCSLSSCRQLDFLPFNCDACGKIYCKDHVKYENHNCTSGLRKDRKVPVCPLCSQPVSLSASENPDHKVNEHIENDCKSDLAKHKRSGKCGVKGCKKRELIPVLCSACKRNFCLRHRHETDHDCQAQTSNRTHQSSAAIQAGRASSSRYNQSLSRNKPTTSRQQTNLSSIGGDLNRARNERQQQASSARMASTVQRTNMSEDEALALAMEASLADTKPKDPTDKKSQAESTDATGDADMALARAIAESEKDERERQRRLNGQPTENNKNSCVLS